MIKENKLKSSPLARLRHHVTGAITRGEAEAIVEKPAADKPAIITALRAFIRQRPGLEFKNYCSGYQDKQGRNAYFAEMRAITKQLLDAKVLLHAVESDAGISGADLLAAFSAYSGRPSWDGERLDYVKGQYWPTEYRAAACAVLARALWDSLSRSRGDSLGGEGMRRHFRERFGRGIQKRWFDWLGHESNRTKRARELLLVAGYEESTP